MERTLTLIVCLSACGMQAQLTHQPVPPHPEYKHAGPAAWVEGVAGMAKGASYFTEDFDNGLNGWTVNTIAGSVDWEVTSTGPGPTSSTYPVPSLNSSTPTSWLMVDDDFYGTPGVATDTWLVSPVIDLSGAPPNLKVEFEQYFQEWEEDHCYVGVSTDGGVTWDEVEINEGVGRDGRPNPEVIDVNISAWVANDPANVQLRFRYTSIWDYGWQIDNVTIKDLPANDMALIRTWRTGFDFDNTGLANIDYDIYPAEQVREMQLKGLMRNKGYDPQTGVTLTFDVQGPNGAEFNSASSPAALAPTDELEELVNGFTPSGDIGTYTLTYGIDQDQTDDIPANNTVVRNIEVSTNLWAQDDGTCTSTQQQGPDNATDAYELGNYFDLVNAGSQLVAIQVAVHESSAVGSLIYGIVYDINTDFVEVTDDHELLAGELTAVGGTTNWITLDLPSPLDLSDGTAYLIMAGAYGGSDPVVFCTGGISDPQVSIIRYPNSDETFFVTKTPMVRAVLAGPVGIGETALNGPNVELWPNPADDRVTVSYELEQAASVTFELHDAVGRRVLTSSFGKAAAGVHRHPVTLEHLAPGSYFWTLNADGARRSGTLIKALDR